MSLVILFGQDDINSSAHVCARGLRAFYTNCCVVIFHLDTILLCHETLKIPFH